MFEKPKHVNNKLVPRIEWAQVPKYIREADVPGLLEEYQLNKAYLTDEDVEIKVEAKDWVEMKQPWKLSKKKIDSRGRFDLIYFGELQPDQVKEGVCGLLVSIDDVLDHFTVMYGIFDCGMAKG